MYLCTVLAFMQQHIYASLYEYCSIVQQKCLPENGCSLSHVLWHYHCAKEWWFSFVDKAYLYIVLQLRKCFNAKPSLWNIWGSSKVPYKSAACVEQTHFETVWTCLLKRIKCAMEDCYKRNAQLDPTNVLLISPLCLVYLCCHFVQSGLTCSWRIHRMKRSAEAYVCVNIRHIIKPPFDSREKPIW